VMRWVVGLVAAAGLVAGCAGPHPAAVVKVGDPASRAQPPGPGAAPTPHPTLPPGVLVVPASSHVTGLPYPAHCVAFNGGQYPDPACTPGALRDDIDPAHLEDTVCKPLWSDSVRPPKAETDRLKTQAMSAYGVPASQRPHTELDHYIPESWGGASDVHNLWAQVSDLHGAGFHNSKDNSETAIHGWICAGHRDQWAHAVEVWVADWTTAKQKLGIK